MSGLMVGSLGASRIADAIAKTGKGWGASRHNLMAEILCERLTGVRYDTYSNPAMQRGLEKEPEARAAYCFLTGNDVAQVEPIKHPKIEWSHASPDGLIGGDGLIEIKCPNTATHLETLLGEPIPDKYIKQMQWQMCVTERAWCDWVSYDDRLPASMQLFVKRIKRDDAMIGQLEELVKAFLAEVDNKVQALRTAYELKATLEASAA